MVKKIVWSLRARNDRKDIFKYWNQRNKSKLYSIKLNILFKEGLKIVARHPNIGKKTDQENIRIKIVRDYFIIYEDTETEIHVLTIWSSHRNPADLKFL